MSVVAHPGRTSGTERFKTLYRLLVELSHATGLEEVYTAALTTMVEATSANRAAILLFDDDGVIRFKASRNLSAEYQAAVTGHSPWLRGAHDAAPIFVPDVLLDDTLASYREHFLKEGIRALVSVPLALDAGVFGKFMLYYDEPQEQIGDEIEIATAIAAHVALATEHKRAEIARARSEQRLQAILDNSPTVIFLKDAEGRYLLVNRRYAELFHVTPAEVVGRTDYDIFPKEMADQFREHDRTVLASGEAVTFEERAPHEGGICNYLSVKFPLQEVDGRITGVCGIATDITDRKQLESASQHLAAIVESSEDAIASKDLNGIITSWNKAAERIFGYTADEAIGRPVAMLAAPDRVNEMPLILSKIRRGEPVGHYETRRRRKDGQIIDVALTVSPVRDAAGKITGASKIARDITELKKAEQERALLLAREQEARRTAELLNRIGPRLAAQLELERLVQEVTDIATTLVGAEFGFFLHNGAGDSLEPWPVYAVSGVAKEAFSGTPMLASTAFRDRAVVRSGDLRQEPRYEEGSYVLPQGYTQIRSYLAAAVIARSSEVLGGLFFGHSEPDKFTENHEAIVKGIAAQAAIAIDNARLFEQAQWAQTELKRSNEDLRRANRDLEVFAYSASHDLQEPLRTIAISAQLLERNCGELLQDENAIFLSDILTASRRMHSLIQDLLAYIKATKYEEGSPPPVESAQALTEVLVSLKGPIEDTGAVITSGELPRVPIHRSRLAQLLQNLIGNAIKYRGQDVPRIHIAAEERDGWCVFSVSDNGIGIESRFADQIFGLFKRLHGGDEYPGSGIGLAICKRVVEQYGGRIWLERSEPGKGSIFCFAIPSGAGNGSSAVTLLTRPESLE